MEELQHSAVVSNNCAQWVLIYAKACETHTSTPVAIMPFATKLLLSELNVLTRDWEGEHAAPEFALFQYPLPVVWHTGLAEQAGCSNHTCYIELSTATV